MLLYNSPTSGSGSQNITNKSQKSIIPSITNQHNENQRKHLIKVPVLCITSPNMPQANLHTQCIKKLLKQILSDVPELPMPPNMKHLLKVIQEENTPKQKTVLLLCCSCDVDVFILALDFPPVANFSHCQIFD